MPRLISEPLGSLMAFLRERITLSLNRPSWNTLQRWLCSSGFVVWVLGFLPTSEGSGSWVVTGRGRASVMDVMWSLLSVRQLCHHLIWLLQWQSRNDFFFKIFICSGFCHILKWNSHGFTWVPHPDPPSHLPPHPLPLGFPIAPGPSTCLILKGGKGK